MNHKVGWGKAILPGIYLHWLRSGWEVNWVDNRTYDNTICVRMVESVDGMTANFAHIPYEILENISRRVINEIDGINRVVYDISSKPPGTIEWE